ncbi:MAG: 2-C-methyl-D-erythritol 4-phosphate cytidylyltransferase [Gammaproteobacteria bacterium]|nr:MAG: 2-C-methyl-D-erythritol 4-phosphate cytidylyltransferase [Gammaproteobacteria bacterium]
MNDTPNFHAIIPAAGTGVRMGADTPKQYLTLAGQTVLEHSLDVLLACQRITTVVLVLSIDDQYWPEIQYLYKDSRVETVGGGVERCHSVLNGLEYLAGAAGSDDWVLVHDAARPCVRKQDIEMLMSGLEDDSVGGLLGMPVADTMKQVDTDDAVMQTVERDGLWRALTPQMFRLGPLRDALQQAIASGVMVTDDAAAMEMAGLRPRMVEGHGDNIKITRPGDLQLAEFYLQSRKTL